MTRALLVFLLGSLFTLHAPSAKAQGAPAAAPSEPATAPAVPPAASPEPSEPSEPSAPAAAAPSPAPAPAPGPATAPQPTAAGGPAAALPVTKAPAKASGEPSSVKTSIVAEGWVALRGSAGVSLRRHHSMDLYTADNTILTRGAGLGVDVWRFRKVLALAVEADWGFEKAASVGVLGGSFRSWYTQHQGNLGVSVRYNLGGLHPTLALISPHLRAFASVAATQQRLTDSATGNSYLTGYQRTGGAGFALGFTVRSPSALPVNDSAFPALSLGLRVEAGYGVMADPEFRLRPVDDSEHPIESHAASLGALQLDAGFLRASFELRL